MDPRIDGVDSIVDRVRNRGSTGAHQQCKMNEDAEHIGGRIPMAGRAFRDFGGGCIKNFIDFNRGCRDVFTGEYVYPLCAIASHSLVLIVWQIGVSIIEGSTYIQVFPACICAL